MSWLLALHSSSEVLGVAVQPLGDGEPAERRMDSFPLGRSLSNQLLDCVEQLLPASEWPRLGRLVVATGPGGFTGTRLTVVLARTLAQQLAIPLHGVSSFELVAARHGITTPTWIVDADHDEAIKRENTEFMAAQIPGAGLLIQPEVSHFSFLQDPVQFTWSVMHFLARH